jgi:acyl-CoA thioester hydrolase
MITSNYRIRVSYADTDQMGVVYYSRYFVYFERARTELMRELGLPYSKMERSGVMLPVTEACCEYKKGMRYDDVIVIRTSISEPPKSRIRMDYEILDEKESRVLATGHTIHSFVDQHGKARRPPKEFVKSIKDSLWGQA